MANRSAPPIEPVLRALAVLAALNLRPVSRLGNLHTITGLPKPTLVRLLQTLVAAGYVARTSARAEYRVTEHVLSLASGVRFIDRMVDAAMAPMSAFTREYDWPLVLGKVRNDAVVVLHSTAPESHLSFERAGYNRTFPLLISALGQAYMAFCPAEERRRLIRGLLATSASRSVAIEGVRGIEMGLMVVRRRGYAITMAPRAGRVLGLAVPIQQSRRVLGSLSMRFARTAFTPEEAAARYLAPLSLAARSIALAVAEHDDTGLANNGSRLAQRA
jgi:IclR family mhp operon transcriptional activator